MMDICDEIDNTPGVQLVEAQRIAIRRKLIGHIMTVLSDSAANVDRAKPADDRLKSEDWTSPGLDWWASFEETVAAQLGESE